MTNGSADHAPGPVQLPAKGVPADELLARIDEARAGDLDWRGGRAFSLVYNSGEPDHEALLHQVADRYLHENALNPFRYPSLLQMELDLVSMGGALLGTGPDCGAVTSGGSTSIFCAVHVARDHARQERGIAEPQIVTPFTAHPAFGKACGYLDVEHVSVPVGADGRVDPVAMAAAITDRTAMVVASAPNYPFGVIDPVPEIAAAAAERGVLCHVDACLGGFLLPFWEQLGEPVPPWDFGVQGVTSMSADIHKYGYAFKGASLVLYRSRDLLRFQHFWYDSWPGGLYASSTPAGTRPAPPIAGAWAAMMHLGQEGFSRLTGQVREAHHAFLAGIDGIAGAVVDPVPEVPVFQVTTPGRALDAVGDAMDARGWNLDRQQGGLHVMLSPYHLQVLDAFVEDLAAAVASVPGGGATDADSSTSTYGGIA
ncbi:pyridoxal phosphate-dependent decarboxylase family protein [Iamia sp.]|uniref:pyridoxal phosphate-dependent decarboxylase family protein n=1 Tax=Iamia sp. TaxID=2722710 RepID=UPI002C656EF1|nr:aminotransferase class V-fold PLP-dependent enzyme [Iamia sp.]HXH59692.1 aminotransferase class V-fold PLP-dependent enzyme [Iamia sp.]